MQRYYYVYILADGPYGTLHVGVTNDLVRRVFEHKNDVVDGYSKQQRTHDLVWYEQHEDAVEAITREKRIKKWHRDWKVNLVQPLNPAWRDSYADICR